MAAVSNPVIAIQYVNPTILNHLQIGAVERHFSPLALPRYTILFDDAVNAAQFYLNEPMPDGIACFRADRFIDLIGNKETVWEFILARFPNAFNEEK